MYQKRGRPSVYERTGFQAFEKAAKSVSGVKTTRGLANVLYQTDGLAIVIEAASDIRNVDLLCSSIIDVEAGKPVKMKQGILEQIGRLHMQDGRRRIDCAYVAQLAANALADGYTAKQVEKFVRQGRLTHKWNFTDEEIPPQH